MKNFTKLFLFFTLITFSILKPMMPPSMPGIETPPTPTKVSEKPEQQTKELIMGLPKEKTIIEKGEKVPAEKVENENKKDTGKSKDKEEKKDIYLNFEDTSLSNFINYIGELKKINLIPSKALENVKISLTVRDPLTIDGAWNIFLTVLEMAGFSIIKVGEVYKIIPKGEKLTQPLPSYINVPFDTLPDSDLNIRYVVFLQNIQVADIRGLLESMLSPQRSVIDYPDVNGMIITDKSFNIKAAMRVIQELDKTGLQETVTVMHLKNANATDVKTLFDTLIKKPEGSPIARLLGRQSESSLEYFSPSTRIIAEERTNSLILMGNQQSIKKIEDFITEQLDSELKGTETPLHIYELQHTDAEQVKDILETVTNVDAVAQAGKYGAVRGGVKYFKAMKFQADKDGNRIIVSTTDKQDWKLIKKTIEDLDKPQPQVAVETLIVTVDLKDTKQLGGRFRNKEHGQIGKGVDFQSTGIGQTILGDNDTSLLGNLISALVTEQGASILTFGKGANIWGIFEALKQQTNTSILSQPFLTITNKKTASITVGTKKRIVSEEINSSDQKSYKDTEANTKIDLTPQINLDGIIRFDIGVTIDEFIDASGKDTTTKNLNSNATVADGQVLVLGGFVKTKVTEQQQKTPIIGDIPVIGWLFKNKKRIITKSYVFIFMSPTIIKPRTEPGVNLYTRMKLHAAKSNINESVETKRTNDPLHNWFFNPEGEDYTHKVDDFANARYQPTTVDIKNDPYYRVHSGREEEETIKEETKEIKIDSNLFDEKIMDQQRERLKDLISDHPIAQKKPLTAESQKRNKLKELISEKPQSKIEVKSKERKQFKDLLTSKPAIANNVNPAFSNQHLLSYGDQEATGNKSTLRQAQGERVNGKNSVLSKYNKNQKSFKPVHPDPEQSRGIEGYERNNSFDLSKLKSRKNNRLALNLKRRKQA